MGDEADAVGRRSTMIQSVKQSVYYYESLPVLLRVLITHSDSETANRLVNDLSSVTRPFL